MERGQHSEADRKAQKVDSNEQDRIRRAFFGMTCGDGRDPGKTEDEAGLRRQRGRKGRKRRKGKRIRPCSCFGMMLPDVQFRLRSVGEG